MASKSKSKNTSARNSNEYSQNNTQRVVLIIISAIIILAMVASFLSAL
jgi:hypothetical protein